MRALLTVVLLLYGQAAFAACNTAKLSGTWLISQDGFVCRVYLDGNGDGSGECRPGIKFAADFALSPSCRFTGTFHNTLNGREAYRVIGQTDDSVRSIVGISVKVGPFVAIRIT